ncbi:MAG: hypothetical protein IJ906_02485 [Oscillospiraceae bacterium]|nr:hypothetical protein [Oscillospiraceae bacterium]
MKTLKIYNTLIATIAGDTNEYHAPADDYANELFEALKKDGTDLAEYIYEDDGSIYGKVHKITISADWVNGKLYGLATCEVDDDWTDADTDLLKAYLEGQYADGWGEGFEQREVDSFTEIETSEEYDEEADEYYESEWKVRYDAYISFWQFDNFRIMTEAELTA